MAVVYLARQTDLDRHVALKELGAFHAADPAFAERFLRESQVAGSLSHPNIVTVHDYFEHDGIPYITMEYLQRGSLRPAIGQLKLAQIAGIVEGLLAGLTHAAKHGIVHRDLKPENLMITDEGGIKIADFGIAKAYNQAATARFLTATGTTVGTPTYMAPEQAMAKDIGPWTDLYSTGVVAYELFAGVVPFHDTDTPMAILLRHVNDPVPSPTTFNPKLDPRLAEWIETLLEKDPQKRPPSADDAWDDLEEIVIGILGPRWRRDARLIQRSATVDTPAPLTPAPFHEDTGEVPQQEEEESGAFQTFHRGAKAEAPVEEAAPLAPGEPAAPVDGEPAAAAPPEAGAPPEPVTEEEPPPAEDEDEADDQFKTYLPRALTPEPAPPPPVEPPPPPPPEPVAAPPPEPPPPPEPEVEPEPAPVAASAEEAPSVPPAKTSFEWPAAAGGRLKRKPLLIVGGVIVLAAIAAAVFAFAGGGGKGSHTKVAPIADGAPPRADQLNLTLAGKSVFVTDPNGNIVGLDPMTLARKTHLTDADNPRSLALSGGKAYVADSSAVTSYALPGLTPSSAARFDGAIGLAGGAGHVAVIGSTGDKRGSICVIGGNKANPCAGTPFTPAGLGAGPDGTFYVADGGGGTVVPYARSGAGLLAGGPITLGAGSKPHGRLIVFRGKLYVPVSRGVAVVDIAGHRKSSTISLPTTPAAIWIVPHHGRLFAALYASNQVAMVDALVPGSKPELVAKITKPVDVGGSASMTMGTAVADVV